MSKHISQKGPFHYVYIGKIENDIDGSNCGYYNNGLCLKDNSTCIKDNYCKYYTTNAIFYKNNSSVQRIQVYTLELIEDDEKDIITVYISKNTIDDRFMRIDPENTLVEDLFGRKVGYKFKKNNTEYIIKNISTYEYLRRN